MSNGLTSEKERDFGWIGKLLEEAENERMHLLTWMQVIRPTFIERVVVLAAQAFYTPFYAFVYIVSPKYWLTGFFCLFDLLKNSIKIRGLFRGNSLS